MLIPNTNNRYKIKTPSGYQDFDSIQKVKRKEFLTITFENGEEISCSLKHKFIKDGKEIYAKDLKSNGYVDHKNKKDKVKIFHIEYNEDDIELYDLLNVENGNIFNANSVISHNCEFLGSAGTLISGKKLKELTWQNPVELKLDGKLKIYELPYKEMVEQKLIIGFYIIIFDTAEGVGGDSSTIQIFRIDEKPFKQVAKYASNTIPIRDFPMVVEKIASLYNNALVLGENNTIGASILDDLFYDFEYENLFFSTTKTSRDEEINPDKFGIRMTTRSKSLGASNLKTNIEDGHFILVDQDTIDELTWFVKKGNSWQADGNRHDDHVTPLIIFSYFLRNREWVNDWLNQLKDGISANTVSLIKEDLLPLGFISDSDGIRSLDENNDHDQYIFYK